MNKKTTKCIFICMVAFALVGGVFFCGYDYTQRVKVQREEDYQNGIAAIESGNYEQGKSLLQPLNGHSEYPDIEMVLLYADIADARANNQEIIEQKKLLDSYDRTYKGLFSDEMMVLASVIDEEYKDYEEEQERIRKQNELEAEREKKAEIAKGIPYVGMSTSYINDTILGSYDAIERRDDLALGKSYGDGSTVTSYTWYYKHGSSYLLVAHAQHSKIIKIDKHNITKYWMDWDIPSGYGSKSNNSNNSGGSAYSKNSNHDSYDDGYDAVYDDGDYDWDRYQSDSYYANGVDDALDDWDEHEDDW